MLEHDEERRLAEIEAQLRAEDPDLGDLFATLDHPSTRPRARGRAHPARDPRQGDRPHPRRRADPSHAAVPPEALRSRPARAVAVVRSLVALTMAIALTTLLTLLVGPDLGGFVGVVSLTAAGAYAYQTLRGCPGLRRPR